MAIIQVAGFGGENRALHPMLLPETVGVTSTNQKPGRGDLRPWAAPLNKATVPSGRNTIYRMGRDVVSDTNYWLSWTTEVHVVCAPNATDTDERTYYSGGSAFSPKWTDATLIGTAPYPTAYRELGVPAPISACLVSTEADTPIADAGKYVYRVSDTEVAALAVGDILRFSVGVDPLEVTGLRVAAGKFAIGTVYKILTVGTTAFTSIGASSNTVGVVFTATGAGDVSTTGTATAQSITLTAGTGGDVTMDSLATQIDALTGVTATHVAAVNAVEASNGVAAVEAVTECVKILSDTVGSTFIIEKKSGSNTSYDPADVTYTTKYTASGAAETTVTAGAFVSGTTYEIVTVGDTDFTLIGSADSKVGTVFTATGVGEGTGTAKKGMAILTIASTDITATNTPVDAYWSVTVNSVAPVLVRLYAGASTFPAAVTATSLAAALNGVTGIRASVVGTTSQNVFIHTTDFGTGAAILVRLITPTVTDTYSRLVSASKIVEPTKLTESRFYTYTYVTDIGEESAPAAPSLEITCKVGATVNISNLQAAPSGAYGINRIRIYRTQTSSSGGDFYFLRETGTPVAATALTNGTKYVISSVGTSDFTLVGAELNTVGTEFTATGTTTGTGIVTHPGMLTTTTDDGRALGEVMPTTTWTMPPKDLSWLTGLWNGMMAGISGRSVRFCEAYTFYAWPPAYEILPTNAQPVALATFGQTLVMLTNGNPSIITGGTPDAMDEQPVEFYQACVAPLSAVGMGHGVAWASPDGLAYIGSGGPRMLTEGFMTRDDWQALNPSSIKATMYERRYLATYTVGGVKKGFVIDPANSGGMYFLDFGFDALYLDDLQDALFVLDGVNIQKWDAGSAKTVTFKSKLFKMPKPTQAFSCAEVVADAYPVTFKLYADGALKHTQTVANSSPFRLPPGYYAQTYQIEVSTTGAIQGIAMAHSMVEIAKT